MTALDAQVRGDAQEPQVAGDAQAAQNAASDAAAQPADAAPTLKELVQTVFVPTCVLGRCHITLAPAGGLSFTGRRVSAYAALVNAPSSEVPSRMRVVPFDPQASYLIEKLTSASPSVGESMPPMGSLQPEVIERIRSWIQDGALDN